MKRVYNKFFVMSFFILIAISSFADTCTDNKKKYQADEECSFTTKTCCNNQWCDGDITCKSSSDCAGLGKNVQQYSCIVIMPGAIGGTLTRTRAIIGVDCDGVCKYGDWGDYSGVCTCNTEDGYTWNNSLKKCEKTGCSKGSISGINEECCTSDCYYANESYYNGFANISCDKNKRSNCPHQQSCCYASQAGGMYYLPENINDCTVFKEVFNLVGHIESVPSCMLAHL